MILATIDSGVLAGVITSGVVIALGILKISFQAGRIERGVSGLYGRIERVERWIDNHDHH